MTSILSPRIVAARNSLQQSPRVTTLQSPRKGPLVSVIVPTKNSALHLAKCLKSIRAQTYSNLELIVVDNSSEDETVWIAEQYTDRVFNKGPERSAQVNFGVIQAQGDYVYKVDSDFVLDSEVVEQCVAEAEKGFDAIVVHNTPDESISWIAWLRKFEVDMYKYDLLHSSARFVKKKVFEAVKGFDESVTAGEDYDFQNKLNRTGYKTGFVHAEATHLGEPKKFWEHMIKCYKYGKDFVNYEHGNKSEAKNQLGNRFIYLKHWKLFLLEPFRGISFLGYFIAKFGFGGIGYTVSKLQKKT